MDQPLTQDSVPVNDAQAPSGLGARLGAVLAIVAIDRRIRAARSRERKLLADAGKEIVASTPLVDLPQADAQALRSRISDVILQINDLNIALGHSLGKDREDYAKASQLMRWIVVGRGFLDRWILRDRVRWHRREQARLSHDLGVLVFDGAHDALLVVVPTAICDGVANLRANIASEQSNRALRLAPWSGQPLPGWLTAAARECRTFLRHFWEQLSRRLFLRVPAIGALVASLWIAHHYTGSTLERIQYSMGLGGRPHMNPETLRLLKFWVPIVIAAICTYATTSIATAVQRKYAPTRDASNR